MSVFDKGYWSSLTKTFPVTSDIWWTVVTGLFLLAILLFVIGESLWGAGVYNFTAYTWYLRYSIPRKVLIGLVIGFVFFAIFVVWHFGFGKGWKVGPNI